MTLQKKEVPKKAYEDRGAAHDEESPLDDPVAEKLRQQRRASSALLGMHICLAHRLHATLKHGCLYFDAQAFAVCMSHLPLSFE